MMYLEMGGLKRLVATIAAALTRGTIIGKLKPVVKRSGCIIARGKGSVNLCLQERPSTAPQVRFSP